MLLMGRRRANGRSAGSEYGFGLMLTRGQQEPIWISLWERERVCVVVCRYGIGVRGCKGSVVSASLACGKKVGRRHQGGGRKGRWEWEWRLEDEMSGTRKQYATK